VAAAARFAVLALAWNRFPPADDGVFYDALARRLAHGFGYTWEWPDGVVTPVAHYPVGYPALVAVAYRVFGEHTAAAIAMHALVGVAGAVAVHVVARAGTSRRVGQVAGLVTALHPALLAYTPALMTEGVTTALIALPFAGAVALRSVAPGVRRALLVALAGAALGATALVRPQALVLAPVVAILSCSRPIAPRKVAVALAAVVVGAAVIVGPWTVRNQRAFGSPVLISANGGWNLWIGTDGEARGGWRALAAPPGCEQVWGEAAKDACFARAAGRRIVDAPAAWLALAPAKLGATFDLGGSGLSYLSRARPDVVPRWAVLAEGGLETVAERAAVLLALVALALESGARRRARAVLAVPFALTLLTPHAWPACIGLAALLSIGAFARLLDQPVRLVALGVLAATAATHVVFFGAGRYGLVVYPWVAALACTLAPELLRRVTNWRVSMGPGSSESTKVRGGLRSASTK
jgi:4-amino-4-deoxy-L-arabinose transferase-like glycosyltransferase